MKQLKCPTKASPPSNLVGTKYPLFGCSTIYSAEQTKTDRSMERIGPWVCLLCKKQRLVYRDDELSYRSIV
eukprot:scaffold1771_cov172-Amphora_coffeaeformis.AAC.15